MLVLCVILLLLSKVLMKGACVAPGLARFKLRPWLAIWLIVGGTLVVPQSARAGLDIIPDSYKNYSRKSFHLSNSPVDFKADHLMYDGKVRMVIATGNVQIHQNDTTIYADKAYIQQKTSYIIAKGNVYIKSGDKNIYADEMRIDSSVNHAIINNIRILLSDKSILSVGRLTRTGHLNQGYHVAYTACPVDKYFRPFWSITASKVQYNEDTKVIKLYNGWLRIKSIPVLWIPYTSYYDPLATRKMGFLAPDFGLYSDLGYYASIPFYIPLGVHQSFSLQTTYFRENLDFDHPSTNDDPLLLYARYNSNFPGGGLNLRSFWTPFKYKDWAVFYRLSLNINSIFRLTGVYENSSNRDFVDKFRVKGYANNPQPFLWQSLSLEGFFSAKDYINLELSTSHNSNIHFTSIDNPIMLPQLTYLHYGDYGKFGKLDYEAQYDNFVTLRGDGNDVGLDSHKLVNRFDYLYMQNTPLGMFNAKVNALWVNYYQLRVKSDPAQNGIYNSFLGMGGAVALEYPVFSDWGKIHTMIEPIVQVAETGYVYNLNQPVRTFDSKALDINVFNLFENDKYGSTDLVDDSSRVNYGLHTSIIGRSGFGGEVMIGQSKSLLSSAKSNYLVYLSLHPTNLIRLDYIASFSNKADRLKEHNLSVSLGNELVGGSVSYRSISNLDPQKYSTVDPKELGAHIYMQLGSSLTLNADSTFNLKHMEVDRLQGVLDHLTDFASAITWQNSCFRASFRVARSFYGLRDQHVATSYQFSFIFKDLGGVKR